MKLRRAMAVAAATAVIAPAAFFAAPAAFATESPLPTPTSDSPSPSASDTTTPGPSDSASQSTSPSPSESTTVLPPSPSASTTTSGSPEPSASTSPSVEPTPSPSTTGDCLTGDGGEEVPQADKNLSTTLSGLPDSIVAGSGYHQFKLNVSNKGTKSYKRVDLGVFAGAFDDDFVDLQPGALTLQYKDPVSGKWSDISVDVNDPSAGYLGYTDIKAKESFSIDLRLGIAKSAKAGTGYAISIGAYVDDQGNCVFSDDVTPYLFDVLAAGSDPGKPNEAKPQEGGKTPVKAKPVGDTQIDPQGNLAETGSSSMVPAIGAAGGIAVLVGAGVVFAMKRRRDGDATA